MAETKTFRPSPLVLPQPSQEKTPEISLATQIATLVAVILPFLGLITAIVIMWGRGFSWVELGLLVGMYTLTVLGITVGYHRLFTHRAFKTNRVVQFILGALGSMAVQGSLLQWVAHHRIHHQHSDKEADPHSPHHHGQGVWGVIKGFFHAHLGWFFLPDPPNMARYVRDFQKSWLIRSISNMFFFWVFLGLAIPTLLGWWLIGGWMGAFLGLLWGGLVRIFFVHHVTWSINSVCHLWGQQPFPDLDKSRNNFIMGILALGEGWHNNHHAFPTSAAHGFRWWQIDVSYWVIRALALVGLAWDIRIPREAKIGFEQLN